MCLGPDACLFAIRPLTVAPAYDVCGAENSNDENYHYCEFVNPFRIFSFLLSACRRVQILLVRRITRYEIVDATDLTGSAILPKRKNKHTHIFSHLTVCQSAVRRLTELRHDHEPFSGTVFYLNWKSFDTQSKYLRKFCEWARASLAPAAPAFGSLSRCVRVIKMNTLSFFVWLI